MNYSAASAGIAEALEPRSDTETRLHGHSRCLPYV
jgi:hypothetical protein